MAVESYIDSAPEDLQPILCSLHEKLMAHPDMQAKIRYKIPFYFGQSWICYLNPLKTDGVELAFVRGNELDTVLDLLDFKGRKQVGGVDIFSEADVHKPEIDLLIQEALLLDRHKPYASKRNKG